MTPTHWGRVPAQHPAPQISHRHGTDHPDRTPPDGVAVVAGMRRRRAASWRCLPLPDGRRDPLDPRCATDDRRPTARELAAWAAATAHLRALGHEPIVPDAVGRAWRRDRCRCEVES
ncbi:MAG: hypothetical protein ACRDT0_21445 [Pseudonocardiaceae bacterium]